MGLTLDNTISAKNDAGSPTGLSATEEGHLEVAIHDPILPFGAVHTENLTPIFQSDPVYGINQQQTQTTTSGTGVATTSDSLYTVSTGTTATQLTTDSCSVWDTAATTVTYSDGYQLLWTGHLGDTGELDHHFGNGQYNAEEVTLQPGEWITLAARAATGSPSYVTGSLNTREDQ